jgi:hypothetical protein
MRNRRKADRKSEITGMERTGTEDGESNRLSWSGGGRDGEGSGDRPDLIRDPEKHGIALVGLS